MFNIEKINQDYYLVKRKLDSNEIKDLGFIVATNLKHFRKRLDILKCFIDRYKSGDYRDLYEKKTIEKHIMLEHNLFFEMLPIHVFYV